MLSQLDKDGLEDEPCSACLQFIATLSDVSGLPLGVSKIAGQYATSWVATELLQLVLQTFPPLEVINRHWECLTDNSKYMLLTYGDLPSSAIWRRFYERTIDFCSVLRQIPAVSNDIKHIRVVCRKNVTTQEQPGHPFQRTWSVDVQDNKNTYGHVNKDAKQNEFSVFDITDAFVTIAQDVIETFVPIRDDDALESNCDVAVHIQKVEVEWQAETSILVEVDIVGGLFNDPSRKMCSMPIVST